MATENVVFSWLYFDQDVIVSNCILRTSGFQFYVDFVEKMQAFRGEKILVDGEGLQPAVVLVKEGTVVGVHEFDHPLEKDWKIVEIGSKVLMPGVVDSHVHINEPGSFSF